MAAATCPPPAVPDLAARIESQRGHLRQLISRSGLPADQHDDAYQDICLELIQADARFDPTRGRYSTFCGAVAKNVLRRVSCRHHTSDGPLLRASLRPGVGTRTRGGSTNCNWDSIPGPDADPLDILLAREEAEAHERAEAFGEQAERAIRADLFADKLGLLSPGLRDLVERIVIGGSTVDQVAEQLAQPVKATRRNLQRAVEVLNGRSAGEAKLDREQTVREMVAADPAVTDTALSEKLGISPAGARKLRRELALPAEAKPAPTPRRPGPPTPDYTVVVPKLRDMIAADRLVTDKAMAAAVGVSDTTVRKLCRRHGLDKLRATSTERQGASQRRGRVATA